MGNLFYDHLQSDYLSSPPNPILRPKRDRFPSGGRGAREASRGRGERRALRVPGAHVQPRTRVPRCGHLRARVRQARGGLAEAGVPGTRVLLRGRLPCRTSAACSERDGRSMPSTSTERSSRTSRTSATASGCLAGDAVVIVDDTQLEAVSDVSVAALRQGRIRPLRGVPFHAILDQVQERDRRADPTNAMAGRGVPTPLAGSPPAPDRDRSTLGVGGCRSCVDRPGAPGPLARHPSERSAAKIGNGPPPPESGSRLTEHPAHLPSRLGERR